MTCLDDETMEALVTGFLDEPARAEAVAHVRQCPACRETLQQTLTVYRALDRVFAEETREDCPSGAELARYEAGELDVPEGQRIEAHLKTCVRCAADLHELQKTAPASPVAEQPGPDDRRFAVATEAIPVVCAAAVDEPSIAAWAEESVQMVYKFPEAVSLPCFVPQAQQQRRLAAGTGKGLRRQDLDTRDSPLQVELVQFGDEVRLTVGAGEEGSQYADSIVRLVLAEGEKVRLTRLIPLRNGRGSCVLSPEEVLACTPERRALVASVEVLDAQRMLRAAGKAAVVEALVGLLAHADPSVRRSAIDLLAESGATGRLDAIAALKTAPDETVRSAASRAWRRLSGSGS